jgi:hypothetical protein
MIFFRFVSLRCPDYAGFKHKEYVLSVKEQFSTRYEKTQKNHFFLELKVNNLV